MPLELLRKLSQGPLPATLTDQANIDKARVLRAAGHITALLSSPDNVQPFARVLSITGRGRAALDNPDAG